jgi:hypothetical protein
MRDATARKAVVLNAFWYDARDDRIPFTYAHALQQNDAYMKAEGYHCRRCKCEYSNLQSTGGGAYRARPDGTIYYVCGDESDSGPDEPGCQGELVIDA